jgi:hypothetical protein
MTSPTGVKVWATGALLLAAISACGSTDADPDPSGSPTVVLSKPSEVGSGPAQTSPADTATADASALVRRYFAVLDAVRQSDSMPPSRLSSVMTSIELSTERRLVTRQRQQGLRQTGDTAVALLEVQSVNLDNSEPSAGRVPTAMVDVCWDVSNADLVGKNGQSVVSPNRADRGWTRYTVANYYWATNPSGGWRVADGQDLKKAPCAAS